MVNNEVGTRNDVERLAAEVKRRNSRTIVHVDAVQAWMRVPSSWRTSTRWLSAATRSTHPRALVRST